MFNIKQAWLRMQRQDLWAGAVGDVGAVRAVSAAAAPLTIYFHGAPGAQGELRVFDAPARTCGLRLLCLDRFAIDAALTGPAYFKALADEVRAVAGASQVNFIGFSIGAFVALHVSRLLGAQVAQLHLVSAAAPLQLGLFLPHMAGGAVFRVATASPTGFKAMTLGQAALASWAPGVLRSVLFRRAVGADRVLASNPAFRLSMNELLHSSLCSGRAGYMRDILAYVQDWTTTPAQVTAATSLWHGSLDNWSPPEMATCLQRVIPNCRPLNWLEGLSHYSCLHRAAPLICCQLASTGR
jgi:pimeloyl-ACP methyl ester carboxylesterase